MQGIAVEHVRNFCFLGHSGSGKTSLIDQILYKLKVNERPGRVDDGTSMADWLDEEKERKISIWAKPFTAPYESGGKMHQLVMLDTPGYADFIGQTMAAVHVSDAAVITVDATSGIEVGTNRSWKLAEKAELPRAIVITGIDKENADYAGTLASIQSVWGSKCVPVSLPTPDGSAVADILGGKIPDAVAAEAETLKGSLIESAAESDDSLIEKYLGGEELTPEEIANGLTDAVRERLLIPVLATSTENDVGIDVLLDSMVRLFPSPDKRIVKDAEGKTVETGADQPMCGLVWRSVNDPFVGQMTYVRVFGGTLKADGEMYNVDRDQKEKVGTLYIVNGKKQDQTGEAHAGDVVALAKLKTTHMNDSLCATGSTIALPKVQFPRPVVFYAVYPKSQGDEDKLATGLSRVAEEDPTIHVERNAQTKELILGGMGDVQITVAVGLMKKRSNVEVDLTTPKVAYKETVTSLGEGHHKHKKQSGGRGQYGEVYLRIEPKQPDEEEWFVDAIVGGAIPSGFVPAVQKGLVEGMEKGAVAGYTVENVKVTLYDGSYHDVDSSEVAFKIAASRALHDAMDKARPVLLEPIMKLKVFVPEQFMGDISGDLNQRRGRILGMGSEDGMQVIEAEAPQAEVFQYSSQIRSLTGGRGSFEMDFLRYDQVPANVAQKVIAEARKEKEEED